MRPHGYSRYHHGPGPGSGEGCRCDTCRAAAADKGRLYRRRKQGTAAPAVRVSPDQAERHLAWLSTQGIGYKTAAEAAGLAPSSVAKLAAGERSWITPQSAAKILGVGTRFRQAGAKVPAAPTWRRVNDLLEAGWTKAAIGAEIGQTSLSLQLGTQFVTQRNASTIEDLWRREVDAKRAPIRAAQRAHRGLPADDVAFDDYRTFGEVVSL